MNGEIRTAMIHAETNRRIAAQSAPEIERMRFTSHRTAPPEGEGLRYTDGRTREAEAEREADRLRRARATGAMFEHPRAQVVEIG
jgi:hypothetical protein